MILAIIGDIHSNLVNLEKALFLIQKRKIDHIIVVGDLQSLESIDIIGLTFIKSSIIFGNADWDRDAFLDKAKKYKNIKIFGDIGELFIKNDVVIPRRHDEESQHSKDFIETEIPHPKGIRDDKGIKIAFCHYPQTAKKLAKEKDFDVIFCGHFHSPWEERVNGTLIIRPGEVAGQIYKPTFCIFDTETMKAELIPINS